MLKVGDYSLYLPHKPFTLHLASVWRALLMEASHQGCIKNKQSVCLKTVEVYSLIPGAYPQANVIGGLKVSRHSLVG